jgi:hypothetical protein
MSDEHPQKYRYRLWCPDCAGDPHGCFDGSSELSEDVFDTYEEAEDAADKAVGRTVWDWEITDEAGKPVEGK